MEITTESSIAAAVEATLKCRIQRSITTGSTARVFIIERPLRLAGAGAFTRCIKVFRHELSTDPQHASLRKRFMREANVLLKISHPNVVKLFDADFLTYQVNPLSNVDVPFLETEAVIEPSDLDDYLKRHDNDPDVQARTFMRFLRDCGDALREFHNHGVYHMDLKPANVVVGADGIPRVTDFGFARVVNAATSEASSSIYTTQKWFPEFYLTRRLLTPVPTRGKANPNRTPYRVARGVREESIYNHGTDLHMFVATARYVLNNILSADARRRLDEELLNDVFDTFTINADRPRGEELPSAEAFIRAIEAASYVDSSPTQTPELRGSSFVRTTRIAPNAHVGITRATDAVIATPAFQRLRSTIQLGFCDYVYPSARHSRFEHSLGTYYWAREYIAALLRNRGSVVFRELFTAIDIQTVLLAALLHDMGQHAVAHNFEEEDSDQTFKHLGFALAMGADKLDGIDLPPIPKRFADPVIEVARRAGANINEDLMRYLATLDFDGPQEHKTWCATIKSKHPEWEVLAEIISGPLDVDKLDYLQRDSYSCGLTYHQLLDTPRLLQSLAVIDTTSRPEWKPPRDSKPWHPQRHPTYSLGIDYKGMTIVETFFFLRKLMLSQVYWHKTVRGVHSLVAFAYRHAKAEAGELWNEHLRKIFFLDRAGTISRLVDILGRSKKPLRRQIAAALSAVRHRGRRLPQMGLELTAPGEFGPVLQRVQALKARGRDMHGEIWLRYQEEIADFVSKVAGLSTSRDGIIWADVPNHPVAGTRNSATNLHYKTKEGVLRGVQTATLSAIEDDALVRETPRYRIYCSTRSGAEKIREASEAITKGLRHTGLN